MRKLVEEEVARQSRWLEFAQKQVDDVRRTFTIIFSVTVFAITVIIGFAGWVGFKSLNELRSDAKDAMQRHLEVASQSLHRTLDERVAREFVDVHSQVEGRLNKEFDRPTIQRTIDDGIDQVVKHKVDGIVRTAVAPVEYQIVSFESRLKVHALVVAARGGDRRAFDQLQEISRANAADSEARDATRLAKSAIGDIISEKERGVGEFWDNSGLYDELKQKPRPVGEILNIVDHDPNPSRRAAALQALIQNPEANMTVVGRSLKHVLQSDLDLQVIAQVFSVLRWHFGANIPMLNVESAVAWIDANPAARAPGQPQRGLPK